MINEQIPMDGRYREEMAEFYSLHSISIIKHYSHARDKHPYFCDRITCLSSVGSDTHLDIYRSLLAAEIKVSDVEASTVLTCEIYEALQAYTHGDYDHAVEELYDCASVVLRMIDAIKGRQKLGNPEKGDGK